MRVLYISPYGIGSTSRMRGEYLKQLLPIKEFKVVDTDIPILATNRIFRSLGWRFKKGTLIHNINRYILNELNGSFGFDMVWIDKGVFIRPEIVQRLKASSGKLVHYTPDPAFTYHRSKLFYEALPLYDYCITTKSFEIEDYKNYGVKTIFCTQGYDPMLHKPYHSFEEKRGVVFIGHKESNREFMISRLLEANIPVTIAGNKWEMFAWKFRNNKNLIYKGKGIYGEQYVKEISGAMIGLGFLSKWIPERHTTRTIEIPACNTALVTEENQEINSIYTQDEAIFYTDHKDLLDKIKYYLSNKAELCKITSNGHQKVKNGKYSYYQILENVIQQIQ
jgi:spore maturation protein CgeB